MSDRLVYLYGFLILIGFADAAYLSAMHFYQTDPGCSLITGCDAVLNSEYAVMLGVPLAYSGLLYYLTLLFGTVLYYQNGSENVLRGLIAINGAGFLFSLFLLYVQAFVLHAFCQYCLLSASVTTIMLLIILTGYLKPSKEE